jgi:hypothetical protein
MVRKRLRSTDEAIVGRKFSAAQHFFRLFSANIEKMKYFCLEMDEIKR